jgi:hypothetical protein
VADLARMKDPAAGGLPLRAGALRARHPRRAAAQRLHRRAPVHRRDQLRTAAGLGYAPIEPDGSFKLQVPADVPLALQVVDAEGRGIQTHTNWIQVRPGERRTCDGCHSPRRGAALNSGPVVNTLPAGIKQSLAAQHLGGETMASLRTRLDPAALQSQPASVSATSGPTPTSPA